MLIVVTRAEGAHHECRTVGTDSWDGAGSLLASWARTAPDRGGYHKCDVTVSWHKDHARIGFRFRFDLDRSHFAGVDLRREALRHAQFHAGQWCPPHLTPEQHNAYLEACGIDREGRERWARFVTLIRAVTVTISCGAGDRYVVTADGRHLGVCRGPIDRCIALARLAVVAALRAGIPARLET